ncbi:MAG: UDP-N-acetylmuramoyl-L-alanyl-D-glutamate--2,6-diaminopimelate ligase [Tepidisphaerales bacterium]
MQLHVLLELCGIAIPAGLANPEVTSVVEDSRRAVPGSLFIARPGTKTDGSRYVMDAASRGAVAALVAAPVDGCPVPQVVVPDIASAASAVPHRFHGSPSRRLKLLGVTGTNGKTTTAYLMRHLVKTLNLGGGGSGRPGVCGLIGTVEIDDGLTARESDMTTPGGAELAELLAAMVRNGCGSAAMEVSSHALHQRRVADLTFAGAGFTNLTGDHLDYHGTMENYAAAKAMLFEMLPADAVAVVNADDPWSGRMVRECRARVVRFGFGAVGDYRAERCEVSAGGSTFRWVTPRGTVDVRLKLVGRHNIENALTAAGVVGEVFGVGPEALAGALSTATGAPGRLQAVDEGQPFAVLVDYAHTDDALRNVLSALRPLVPSGGRLRVVFGCGGDRDRTKRPRMARVAETLADVLYLTSDNPRTEDPEQILREIEAGLSAPPAKPTRTIVDRRSAIEAAIGDAAAGDVVLIAGKGHENYQIVGTTKHHFDDVEEARRVLRAKGVSGGG